MVARSLTEMYTRESGSTVVVEPHRLDSLAHYFEEGEKGSQGNAVKKSRDTENEDESDEMAFILEDEEYFPAAEDVKEVRKRNLPENFESTSTC